MSCAFVTEKSMVSVKFLRDGSRIRDVYVSWYDERGGEICGRLRAENGAVEKTEL